MAAFEVVRHTPLSAEAAWTRLTDWPRHGGLIPLTGVSVASEVTVGVGTVFVARTSIGPLAFDDVMQVTYWRAPTDGHAGVCRIVKLGRVVTGWAVLTVTPALTGKWGAVNKPRPPADVGSHDQPGAVVRWREAAQFRAAGPLLNWPNALAGRYVFGRLMDGLLSAQP